MEEDWAESFQWLWNKRIQGEETEKVHSNGLLENQNNILTYSTLMEYRFTFSLLSVCWAEDWTLIILIVHCCFKSIVLIMKTCHSQPLLFWSSQSLPIQDHHFPFYTNSITILGHKSTSSMMHPLLPQFLDCTWANFTSNMFPYFSRNYSTCEIFNHEIPMTEHSVFISPSLPPTNSI